MSADVVLSIPIIFIALLVLGATAAWASLQPLSGACLILGIFLLETILIGLPPLPLGILLYPSDIIFLILGVACFIRFTVIVSVNVVRLEWWILGAVQFSLFIWGLMTFGKAAGVDYRIHFYFWIGTVYFASFKFTEIRIRHFANIWVIFAIALCMLVYYRWFGYASDPIFAKKMDTLVTTGTPFRVVGAAPTLVIAIAFLVLLHRKTLNKLSPVQWLLIPIFFITVVALQHRSVWISLIIGTICLAFIMSRRKNQGSKIIGILLIMAPLILFPALLGKDSSVLQSINNSANRALSTKEGTMVARVYGWQELLSKWAASKNIITYMVGKPYGSGYTRSGSDDGKTLIEYSPHNHFVHILYRGGLIGLTATLLIFYQLLTSGMKLLKAPEKTWGPFFITALVCLLTFYIPYGVSYEQSMLLGIAMYYFGFVKEAKKTYATHWTQSFSMK